MKLVLFIAASLLLGLGQVAWAADSAGGQKADGNKGITVEDIARGLKSAEQNIEKEIPKIGSAIGNTVKKITEKGPEKPSSQDPSKEKK